MSENKAKSRSQKAKDRWFKYLTSAFTEKGVTSEKARLGLIAEQMRKSWGEDSANRFAANNGVTPHYRMACQLSAVQGV